jgi:flagellar protein FlbD
VIVLTRLSGATFALNCDLIERVDCTPDTVITLVDGAKYVVQESLDEVVVAVRVARGAVIAESANLAGPGGAHDMTVPPRRPTLLAVPGVARDQDR